MKLLYTGKALRAHFPERQFCLGEFVMSRTGTANDLKYHYGLRVVKILDEKTYDVQDQLTGDVYEVGVENLYLDSSAAKKREDFIGTL